MSKGKPIPVRFEQEEAEALAELSKRTGLTVADIIRRCLRMLYGEVQRRKSVGFILDLTSLEGEASPPPPPAVIPKPVIKYVDTNTGQTKRLTSDVAIFSTSEDPPAPAPVEKRAPLKGHPHPKSTAGIRAAGRPKK